MQMIGRGLTWTAIACLSWACSGGTVDIGDDNRTGLEVDGAPNGHVGAPCVPETERAADFPGWSLGEVAIEEGMGMCETRTCLINHYQGRVSCPYGQDEDSLALPPDDPRRCRTPGLAGAPDETAPVTVAVPPAYADRPPQDAAYCSCRCDGPDPSVDYCECPSGFSCEPLIEDLLSTKGYAGSYCVKQGTEYDPNEPPELTCELGSSAGDPTYCGYQGGNP